MSLWRKWGFSRAGWRDGRRGEYWLLVQIILLVGFIGLPAWPSGAPLGARIGGIALILTGVVIAWLAARTMGRSLTPLPHPPDGSRLITSGVYRYVRHPIYGSVLLMTGGTAVALWSLPHLLGTLLLLVFFDAKARREELWLRQRFADYEEYARRVHKLLPGVY
ncbi:MAG: isoprenylcysteine carboxylmethyltransferase family protein [Pseudomonadales bacterium]|nr:isoprenylcysteine carboxylmethyltransferase family protein [Pseudomonadales bacterium]